MKLPLYISALVSVVAIAAAEPAVVAPRERLPFDADWRFALGHASDTSRDFDHATRYFSYVAKAGFGDGPASADFDDRGWRQLNLPHDWAVELPFDARGSASHGFKAIGRNFPENSVGWYRKTFPIPASDLGRRITVEFDGVYRNAAVWVNGFYLGRQPSGYMGFAYDITDYLNYGGDNVVAVRADATMEEGWFYEGAGVYRHVWLGKTSPVHVAHWGVFVTTDVGSNAADVTVRTTVNNDGPAETAAELEQTVLDPDGRAVATVTVPSTTLTPGASREIPCRLQVSTPQLWSLDHPVRYRLVTTVRRQGEVLDRFETPFGIRTVRFDPNNGFFLNGQRVELKGANVHQDHAGVGVALPDALQEYRIRRLKEFGVNAYRCAHNPPTPELLDACDRIGLLVLDENRLMGSSPEQLVPLTDMIRRDRNHPSLILWSIGNEEWEIEGNIKGARIAATMQALVQRLDPTRRVTAAISGGWGGTSTVIDVVGYNYISQSNPDDQHAKFPQQPGVGTEETTTQQTRGVYFDDRAHVHLGPQERGDSGGNCEKGWKYYAARPFLAGLFLWTGFDYRGEPTPFGWPAINSQMGLMDTCGFRKDISYYLEAWWTDRPVLHIATHWNWPGREGQPIKVVCYGNDEAIELLLNGTSLGRKDMPRNGHLEWMVPFQPGVLEARGYRGAQLTQSTRVETTGAATQLALTADRSAVHADRADVAVFTVSAVDAKNRPVPTADNPVEFAITGGRILGVGNGDPGCHEPDQAIGTITPVAIDEWAGRIAPAGTADPSNGADFKPLSALGNWLSPQPKDGEVYDLAATVTLPVIPTETTVELLLPRFGAKTSVWLNGQLLAREADSTKAGPAISLRAAQLITGANRIQLIVTPMGDHRNHIPEVTRIGSVCLRTPAPPVRRSLFNGFAQVIVQASGGTEPLRLTARSTGLASADATVTIAP